MNKNKNKYKYRKESSIATALHNMGAHPGSQKEENGEFPIIELYWTGSVVSDICS